MATPADRRIELTPQERNNEIASRFPDVFGERIEEARRRGWSEDKIFKHVSKSVKSNPGIIKRGPTDIGQPQTNKLRRKPH